MEHTKGTGEKAKLTRKEQAEQRKARIIEVAENKIRNDGYDSIKVSDLAKECEMSVGNFYNYFSSLDDLFDEIDSTKFYKSFILSEKSELPVTERVINYCGEWIRLSLDYYGVGYMYYWTKRYTGKDSENKSDNRVRLIAGHIATIVGDGVARGELIENTPVKEVAYSVAFMIFGCSAYFGSTGDKVFIREWYKSQFKAFIEEALNRYIKK